MLIVKIALQENGGHDNQAIDGATPETFPLPEGWAVIPEAVGTMETLEHFPFGELAVEDVDGVPTVTGWTPLPVPAPEEPAEEPSASLEERVDVLETTAAAISAAVRKGFNL